jgi:6-phosphogluconolactonase
MKLMREADAAAVSASAARVFDAAVAAGLSERGVVHIALAGGTTPEGAYELVAPTSWDGVELWFGDERCVPPDDAESNYLMVSQKLLPHAEGAVVHRIEGELGAEAAALDYEVKLRARVAGDPMPVFDLILLGIGEDGHTASLFPGAPTLDAHGVACLAVHDSPKPPPDRVSLSLELLRAARSCVLLASGEGKAQALAGALGEPTHEVPSSLLERERLTVIADEAALGG